jgi:ADP-ribosylglycohydrolase
MMAGAIAGAIRGSQDLPTDLVDQLSAVNAELHGIDFARTVDVVVAALAEQQIPIGSRDPWTR